MISREAKERKMRAKIEKENEENKSLWGYAPWAVSIVSTGGLLLALYFLFKQPAVEHSAPPTLQAEEPKKKVSNKKFEEL